MSPFHTLKKAESHLNAAAANANSEGDGISVFIASRYYWTMLTITLKTLQQQTFKIQMDEELTVGGTELPLSKLCSSSEASEKSKGP